MKGLVLILSVTGYVMIREIVLPWLRLPLDTPLEIARSLGYSGEVECLRIASNKPA